MSWRCPTHNVDYSNQCPVCRAEEEATDRRMAIELLEEANHEAERRHEEDRAREEEKARDEERRHEEFVDLRKQEIYERQNPGQHQCPDCRYKTLLRDARCVTQQLAPITGHQSMKGRESKP